MAYKNTNDNRLFEYASKSSHSQIIKDKNINDYLKKCQLPKDAEQIDLQDLKSKIYELPYISDSENPIKCILTFDSGYNISTALKSFPSSQVALFQFGVLYLRLQNLQHYSQRAFIAPKEMVEFKKAYTFTLVLPIKGVRYENETSLLDSVRRTINDFFKYKPNEKDNLLTTLRWFIYQQYNYQKTQDVQIKIKNCPNPDCSQTEIILHEENKEYSCPKCKKQLFLIDIFRIHEMISEESGAKSIMAYLSSIIEQLCMVHYIRLMINLNHQDLYQALFLRDGSLGFFDQDTFMHRYMRKFINFLQLKYPLFITGLEKTGPFVEHAAQICHPSKNTIKPYHYFLLNNDYIYKYIRPGRSNSQKPYGSTSYYGSKLIFKDSHSKTHIVNIPVAHDKVVLNPKPTDFKNLHHILNIIDRLKCDRYKNSLLPMTLINQSVSLSHKPSKIILEKFAQYKIKSE